MDLVDEQDRARIVLDLLHHGLEPFLEVAAIARAGQQRAHVEGEDGGILQHLGHLALHDLAREAFGDGRLADAGVADEQGIVLLAAAQHLDGAQNFLLPPDQRIDAAVLGLLVEVDAVGVERVLLLLLVVALVGGLVLVDAAHVLGLGHAGPLGDAVGDVLDRIEAGHLLLLQEEGGVALALGEDGDEHVGAGHFLAAGGLHVHHGAVDDALEAGGGLSLVGALDVESGQLAVEIFGDAGSERLHVDRAGLHHGRRIAVVEERQQQVLQCRVLVVTLVGVFESAVEGGFEAL